MVDPLRVGSVELVVEELDVPAVDRSSQELLIGTRSIDILVQKPGIEILVLFSPALEVP